MQQKRSTIKRLDQGRDSPKAGGAVNQQFFTAEVLEREEAVDSKLKLLRGNFFGRPLVKFELEKKRDVWVPYCYLEYEFSVQRKLMIKKKGIEKEGKIGLVFDLNELHPFQYDLYENGPLPLKTGCLSDRFVLKNGCSLEAAAAKAEDYIQYKIMRRFYGAQGRLKPVKVRSFFRPAVELEILYKGSNRNLRYAYLDEFAAFNEHVLGLKYRVENNF